MSRDNKIEKIIILIAVSTFVASLVAFGYALFSEPKEILGGKSKSKAVAHYENIGLEKKMEARKNAKPPKPLKKEDIESLGNEIEELKKRKGCDKLTIKFDKPTEIGQIINNIDTLIKEERCE